MDPGFQRSPLPGAYAHALEDHGGFGITTGPGAIDRDLHEKLVANAGIVKRLSEDDSVAGDSRAKLSNSRRLALLAEFRDGLLSVAERMNSTRGIMQRMPQLPVAMNLELADALLPPAIRRETGRDGKAEGWKSRSPAEAGRVAKGVEKKERSGAAGRRTSRAPPRGGGGKGKR
jgi:hypothetical protein